MKDWTTITFSAKMNEADRKELEKRLPVLLEAIGISDYNFDASERQSDESEA